VVFVERNGEMGGWYVDITYDVVSTYAHRVERKRKLVATAEGRGDRKWDLAVGPGPECAEGGMYACKKVLQILKATLRPWTDLMKGLHCSCLSSGS